LLTISDWKTGIGASKNADGSYAVQDQTVRTPVVVRDAASLAATYLVPSVAAAAMLPGDDFEVMEFLPGRAMFSIAAIDYRDNDLGDYNEISIAMFVRHKSESRGIPYVGAITDLVRNRAATFIRWLPVNQSFTRDAGDGIWGFPKTIETIDFDYPNDTIAARLESEGKMVLEFKGSTVGTRELPGAPMKTWTYIDGRPHRTVFASQSSEVGMHFGKGSELTLGDHPFCDELRKLGLPKKPLMTVWMGKMHATFGMPEAV
jgi:hypothetical protein